jgi:hypothetical protein
VTRRISAVLDLCLWPIITTGASVLACVDDRLLRWIRDVPVDDETDVAA